MKTSYIILLVTLSVHAFGQWSTSTKAESALYVCPGFEPGIITYSDGSSLVLGALSGSIHARKLDQFGNYLWAQPVRLFLNDSAETDIGDLPAARRRWYCSDGDGGALVYWYDYTGAYLDVDGYKNNSLFVQLVDKNGNVKWGNGVKLIGIETGKKSALLVNDDSGGCIVAWLEQDFGYPQAKNYIGLQIARVGVNGTIMWKKRIATGTSPSQLGIGGLTRIKDRYFFQTNLGAYVIAQDSSLIYQSPIQGLGSLLSLKDSLIYNITYSNTSTQDSSGREYYQIKISKFNLNLDTLWIKPFWILSGFNALSYNNRFIVEIDKIFYCFAMYDTPFDSTIVYRLTPEESEWVKPLITTNNLGLPTFGPDNEGGILIGTTDYSARRYNQSGLSIWSSPVKMISNMQDAYFCVFESDNNGGMIAVYWTTFGGIFAKHSGRTGKLGLLTKVVKENSIPNNFELNQNYPNPFNSLTIIKFTVPKTSKVKIVISDILGRTVTELIDDTMEKGTYSTNWNGTSRSGQLVSSGTYIYSLIVDGKKFAVKKLLHIK
ncbi:MAG: T9SS type A sorting domain-containing protein [Bacteroidetes bacterium]|nr:T9SS type A sorting domain-containing protein [Bacteroidota bacterium]